MKKENKNLDSEKNEPELPGCCSSKPKKEPKNVGQAVLYGLIPHVGCIAFIIGSVLGVTMLTEFFKPLLMSRNFFYILIATSLLLATISSMLYLRKTGYFTSEGIKKKWKYLTTMYGVTIGVNLLLFMIIFPLAANLGSATPASTASIQTGVANAGGSVGTTGTASTIDASDLASLQLKVDIPCPGHAPLITSELKKINGVQGVKFSFPNNFEVTYDSLKASKQEILALSVFNEYKASVLSEFANTGAQQDALAIAPTGEASIETPSAEAASGATGGCGCGGVGCGGCGGAGAGSTRGGCGGSAGGGCGGCGGAKAATGATCGVYQ